MLLSKDLTWSKKTYDLRDFVTEFLDKLPVVMLVTAGFLGNNHYEEISSFSVFRICRVREQYRLRALDSEDTVLSVPVSYPVPLRIIDPQATAPPIGRHYKIVQQLLEERPLPVHIEFETSSSCSFIASYDLYNPVNVGVLELQSTYEENYLVGNMLHDGDLYDKAMIMPCYLDIQFKVATGFSDGTEEEWRLLQEIWMEKSKDFVYDDVEINQDILVFGESDEDDYMQVVPGYAIRYERNNMAAPDDDEDEDEYCPRCPIKVHTFPPPPPEQDEKVYYDDVKPPLLPRKPKTLPDSMTKNDLFASTTHASSASEPSVKVMDESQRNMGSKVVGAPNQYASTAKKLATKPFSLMEEMHEKLKLLNAKKGMGVDECDSASAMKPVDNTRQSSRKEITSEYLLPTAMITPLPPDTTGTVSSDTQHRRDAMCQTKGLRRSISIGNDQIRASMGNDQIRASSLQRSYSIREAPQTGSLSSADIVYCLQELKLHQYVAAFEAAQIDGELLLALDEEILQAEFEMSPFHARKLMKFAKGWRPQIPPP